MCRRFIHVCARARVISQNFFPLTAKKRRFFLREMCSIFSLGRSTYSRTALSETDNAKGKRVREGHTTHTREVVCTFLSFLPPERYMCADYVNVYKENFGVSFSPRVCSKVRVEERALASLLIILDNALWRKKKRVNVLFFLCLCAKGVPVKGFCACVCCVA